MTELNLEAIRLKAANPVTATDQEWAQIVNYLLIRIEDLEETLRESEREYEDRLEYADRLNYGGA